MKLHLQLILSRNMTQFFGNDTKSNCFIENAGSKFAATWRSMEQITEQYLRKWFIISGRLAQRVAKDVFSGAN